MSKATNTSQQILKGRAVSRGTGLGKALCLYGQKRQFYRLQVESEGIAKELRRFRASVRLASMQLRKMSNEESASVGENQAGIFETHLLFLQDKSLLTKIEKTIEEQRVNAEWAVKTVADSYVARYKSLGDKHLREKYIDLEDIAERLLTALGGGKKSEINLARDMVVVAKEVNPSTLIELSQSDPIAIVTENGGWTSHAFILARELGIPAVTGLKGILRTVETGDKIAVDGFSGDVILNPSDGSLSNANALKSRLRKRDADISSKHEYPIKTLDGIEITVRANLDFTGGYEQAESLGAKGIGLFRSEFLFNQNRGFPTEEEQFQSYAGIAEDVGENGVRIRTFDLTVDQLAGRNAVSEKNPALGLSAIRLSLLYESEFRVQLRALLRASYGRQIDIVLPMISDVSEIRRARKILEEESESLKSGGIEIGSPQLGAMIEVPSAVLVVDKILEEVDFISLGTNDLVQYLLAVDRDNEEVADWFRTLHPAILRSIKMVARASRSSRKPLIICGEMAGSPLYVPILIGLGATDLSMNILSIPRVLAIVTSIAYEEAREVVEDLMQCATADEIEEEVSRVYLKRWKHLFDQHSLPVNL